MSKKSCTFAANLFKKCNIMAKQSGLHQIRGKVGEHSYYRQTGVSSGLIRSINQGMSARVKTAPEYSNTRLLNAEFGQACRVAAAAVRGISPKFRPMILPFSQSKMAKSVYEAIISHDGVWGRRGLNDTEGEIISAALGKLSKNSIADWGLSWENDPEDPGITLSGDATLFPAQKAAVGADGVTIRVIACNLWEGEWQIATGKYATSTLVVDAEQFDAVDNFSEDLTISMPADAGASLPVSNIHFYVIVVMPYRNVGENDYILQESCAFGVVPRNLHNGPIG